jgi:hypothetical protein
VGSGRTPIRSPVWLQVDAQNGWPDIVASANNAFEKANPALET